MFNHYSYIRAKLRGDTSYSRGDTKKKKRQSPQLHSFNQQRFVEEHGIVLSVKDTDQESRSRQ